RGGRDSPPRAERRAVGVVVARPARRRRDVEPARREERALRPRTLGIADRRRRPARPRRLQRRWWRELAAGERSRELGPRRGQLPEDRGRNARRRLGGWPRWRRPAQRRRRTVVDAPA